MKWWSLLSRVRIRISVIPPGLEIWIEPPPLPPPPSDPAWKYGSGGKIPANASEAGCETTGEVLYIARANIENGLHIGKVRPGLPGAHIPLAGQERIVNPYQVYVGKCSWKPASGGNIPDGAIVAGWEADHKSLYVARAEYKHGYISVRSVRGGKKPAFHMEARKYI